MATKLTKNLVRESLSTHDGREIMVTLTDDQRISMKLKGMKSGDVSIDILTLYKQLAKIGDSDEEKPKSPVTTKTVKTKKGGESNPVINLHDLRSMNAVSTLDIGTMTKFDALICELIEHTKKINTPY